MDNLKLVESVLDGLIKSCSQQLFEVTDNLENAAYPLCAPLPRCHVWVQILEVGREQTTGSTGGGLL